MRYSGDTSPLSGYAIDNYWKSIRSFFVYAEKSLGLRKRPDRNLGRPKFSKPVVKPFSRDEVTRMIKDCEWVTAQYEGRTIRRRRPRGIFDKALILMFLETGMRLGEVARLKIKDVNLKTGEVAIENYSTGIKARSRFVYLGNTGKHAVWVYLAKRAETEKNYENDPDDPLFSKDATLLRDRIEAIGKRCGIVKPTPHRFRYTFAIEFLRGGGDVYVLRLLLGHSTLTMVSRYLEIAKQDLEDAVKHSIADRWKL